MHQYNSLRWHQWVGILLLTLIATFLCPSHLNAAEVPEPLPDECGGINPPGEADPVCCLFGYVYEDGVPSADVQVTIQSAQGILPLTTARGTASSHPYYVADLSVDSLAVTAGSLITVTAQQGENQQHIVYRVVPGAQQVDVALPRSGTWSTPNNLTNDPAHSKDVNMVMDSTGRLHMVWRDGTDEGRIAHATRSQYGGSFEKGFISNSGGWADGHNSLFVDQNDTLHLVMTNENNVYYAQKPAGEGWTTAASIHATSNGAELPSVTVDGQQTTHVVWDDWENGELWYVSKPDGSLWGTPTVIIDRADELWSPSIVADRDNTLHLVYHAGVSSAWEIYYVYKPAGGTWSSPINISNTSPGSWYPDMIIDADDGLHVVWYEYPMDNGGDLYYAYKPYGAGWTAATPVYDTGGSSYHPRLALDREHKTLHLVWDEDYNNVYYSVKPWGHSWSAPGNLSLSGVASQKAAVVTDGARLYVAWAEGANPEDVYYAEKLLAFPPVATIHSLTPFTATQGLDTVYFNGSGQDTDEAGASIVAYRWQSSRDGVLSTLPIFSLQATQFSTGTHTIALTVQDDEGRWSEAVTRTLTILPGGADANTLILVNRQKLVTLYSETDAANVMARLTMLAQDPSVNGVVVRVESEAAVAAAYSVWDDDPTDTAKANAVTEALRALIQAQWDAHPDLTYLVIVGDDRAIPFRRVPDRTRHPEKHYALVSPSSTVGSALKADMTLTDDYYGDAVPTLLPDGGTLYIPDLGIGRLIEEPDDIVEQIDVFLAEDTLAANDAVVTGYDFLQDGAQAMCATLSADGLATDCTLIGNHWRRTDFITQVLTTRHAFAALNGHANHYRFSVPLGAGVTSDDFLSAGVDHTRALFYTLGCHAGLNVPPDNPYQAFDLPQALIQLRALYVANTGYGWGYQTSVGLSEQLMRNFTENIVYGQSATPGLALASAKQAYYLGEADFDAYDEKIMLESTLYGLPMYHYQTPTGGSTARQTRARVLPALKSTTVTTTPLGLTLQSVTWEFPALIAESTDEGVVYTFGNALHLGDGEPVQPKYTHDLHFPETQSHGVIFRGGIYTDVAAFDPVIEQAITETVPTTEPTFSAPGWYPAIPHTFNRLESGGTLVTLLGQYHAASQTERLYDTLSFDFTYHDDSDDWTAPTLTEMQSGLATDTVTITVRANDDSGIYAVVVAYTGGNDAWESVSLTEIGGTWSGSWPGNATTAFFVQVVDEAGNVTVVDKAGLYFQPGDAYEEDVPLSSIAISGPVTGTINTSYVFTATVDPITATTPITYNWQTVEAITHMGEWRDTAVFSWTTPGPHTLVVTATNAWGVVTTTHEITLYTPAQADFTAAPVLGPAPLTVNFTNASTGDYATSLWDFGDGITSAQESPTHTYVNPDIYTVTLTVSGPGGVDMLARPAYIHVTEPTTTCVPLADIAIAGPRETTGTLYIGGLYTFNAVVTPTNATQPITYTWSPTPDRGQGTDEAVYRWATPGTYTITLRAENCGGMVTTTHTVILTTPPPVCPVPLTGVGIVGPLDVTSTLYINTLYSFQAVITPTDATPPITYTWMPAPVTGQGTASATYRWRTPGTYTLMLAVENCDEPVTATHSVNVQAATDVHRVYLPVVLKHVENLLPSGQVTIYDGGDYYGESGFNFSTNTVVAWNSSISDLLAAKTGSPSAMSFFLPYDAPPYSDGDDARAGIIGMSQTELNQVSECPESGYHYHWVGASPGGVYCVRTRDGAHYAVIKLTSIGDISLSFTWVYQPNGSRRFD